MKEDEIAKYVFEHQLVSLMNNTKWKELVRAITADPAYLPRVNIKLIFDKENNGGFSPVSWEEVERDEYKSIEWLEINPIKEEWMGALVPPKTTDYTDFITRALNQHGIPFEMLGKIFKISGYQRTR